MTKRKLLWASVITLLVLAFVGLYGFYGTHTVSLTETQIQKRIDGQLNKEFPVKGKAHFFVKTIAVKSAVVHIKNGQLTALVGIEGNLRGDKKFNLMVHTVGIPSYASGAFFFRPSAVEVQSFSYEGAAPAEQLKRFAERYVSDEKTKLLALDSAPKIEGWMTEIAQDAAMYSLERRPVYQLKDDVRGIFIKASLESVKIDNDRIIVTFSLMQLTLSVLFGIFCVIAAVGMVIALLQFPLLGTAAIVSSW